MPAQLIGCPQGAITLENHQPIESSSSLGEIMRRRRPVIEFLEQRHLLAVDYCVPEILPLMFRPENAPATVEQAGGKTQILFQDDDSGGGIYHPLDLHADHHDPSELPEDHPLHMPRFRFGRLKDGFPDQLFGRDGHRAGPNLRVTNTQILRDGNGGFVSSIPIGQMVVMQVNFVSEEIPVGTSFTTRFEMDGVPIEYTTNQISGNGSWFIWWSGWYASPTLHNLSITLDVFNQISETDENDNARAQAFTPYQATDLPEQLIFPTAGVRNRDYAVTNYADIDPRSGQQRDFMGGVFQYDGHNAWDLGPMNFLGQDQGLPILAAAGGVVAEVADGHFDRKTDWSNTNANYVIIDHGNNWRTIYWHLARDSVTVRVGQTVAAGTVIGEMGSSGISTGTHIHYSLYRNGFPVESMYDTGTYYRDFVDVDYQLATPTGSLIANISNINSPADSDWRESFPTKRVFTRTANDPVVLNHGLSHMNTGESITLRLRRPDGSVRNSWNWTADGIYRFPQFYWWFGAAAWKEQVGTWQWDVLKDGNLLVRESFQVTDGPSPAQMRVSDPDGRNVNPGRTTPFDFGTTLGTQRAFTITNHGDSPLQLGLPKLPQGFSISGFQQTVPVGGNSVFTVRFDNAFSSTSFGSVRFTTNDPELPEFWFNVEGRHAGNIGAVPVLELPGPDLAYELGDVPQIIDSTATFQSSGSVADFLSVAMHGAAETGDVVQILHQGTAAGQVGVAGNEVSFGGTVVGTLQSTSGLPELLRVQFNAAITAEAITAILRRLAFHSTTENALPRFLRTHVADLTGTSSTHAYKGIRVHEPVLILAGVEHVQVNNGDAQRSRVESLQIRFTNEVFFDSSSFVLEKLGSGGGFVNVSYSTDLVYGKTIATLQFSGSFVEHGSLVDGNYRLRIRGVDARGVAMDGDGDGDAGGDFIFGENATDKFFRLFGDTSGDRTVTLGELTQFRSAFGRSDGQSGYRAALDFDDSGLIGLADLTAFRARYGRSI